MDIKNIVKGFYNWFLEKNTDYHPGIPCSEKDFERWANIYIGVDNINKKVKNKLKKKGYIKV